MLQSHQHQFTNYQISAQKMTAISQLIVRNLHIITLNTDLIIILFHIYEHLLSFIPKALLRFSVLPSRMFQPCCFLVKVIIVVHFILIRIQILVTITLSHPRHVAVLSLRSFPKHWLHPSRTCPLPHNGFTTVQQLCATHQHIYTISCFFSRQHICHQVSPIRHDTLHEHV